MVFFDGAFAYVDFAHASLSCLLNRNLSYLLDRSLFRSTRLDSQDWLISLLNPDLCKVVVQVVKEGLVLHQLDLEVVVGLIVVCDKVVDGLDQ